VFTKSTAVQESPTTDRYIDTIVERVPTCTEHPSPIPFQPCYEIPVDKTKDRDRSHNWGVCGIRTRRAGFNGEISSPPAKK
jgi:hypothetical protein